MLVLLPPSEGKSRAPGTGCFATREPELAAGADAVFRHVDALKPAQRDRFYGSKSRSTTNEIHAANQSALASGCVIALERYTGVVYRSLDYAGLARPKEAQRRVCIVSGYFGLVTGSAMLPYYKMPINPWLTQHWLSINTQRLSKLARRKPVLSLLPQAYARAIAGDSMKAVDFRVEGGRKSAGHHGKAIKGTFVRWLMENKITSMKDIGEFAEDGYKFDGANFIRG